MKKICLIGKLNAIGRDIYEMLSQDFHVQLCGDDIGETETMLKIIKPDIILVCTSDMGDEVRSLADMLQRTTVSAPVLCVCSKEELACMGDYAKEAHVRVMIRPVTNRQIWAKLQLIQEKKREDRPQGANSATAEKKRVQVIDDSKIQLRMLHGLLTPYYDVGAAMTAQDALKQMEKKKPELILLDYDMPGCDGKQTFERIKQDERYCDIPVVFLTGVNDKQRIQAVLGMSPAGYLLKPVSKENLLKMTRDILGV